MGACCSYGDQNNAEIDKYMNDKESAEKNISKLLFLGPGGSGKSTIFKMLQYIHDNGFSERQKLIFATHIHNQIIDQMKVALRTYHAPLLKQSAHRSTLSNPDPITPSSGDWSPKSGPETSDDHNIAQTTNQMQIHKDIINNNNNNNSDHEELSNTFPYDHNEMDKHVEVIMQNSELKLTDSSIKAIEYIWNNHIPIQNAFAFDNINSTHKKVLDESSKYFWNDLHRITREDYMPNDDDILNVRARTIGIIEKNIEINDQRFLFVDVGGQKNERKKWISAFDSVRAVIFVVSLSSYNENMFEDSSVNCMVDALNLFDEICNNTKAFVNTDIILFLNKMDLFHDKIQEIAITECPAFSDFGQWANENKQMIHSNPNNYEQVSAYIQYKFHSINRSNKRILHTHLTCALNKMNIKTVFDDVQQMIVNKRLHRSGMLPPPSSTY